MEKIQQDIHMATGGEAGLLDGKGRIKAHPYPQGVHILVRKLDFTIVKSKAASQPSVAETIRAIWLQKRGEETKKVA